MHRKEKRNLAALTMMEMVISLAIMAVVFAALLPQFRNIQNSWASRQGTLETLQNGRVVTDFLTRNLATAMKITDVSDPSEIKGFIEFEDINGDIWKFSLSKQDYVQYGQPPKLFDLGGPVEQLQFTCYALEDMDTPITDVDSISYVKAVTTVIHPSSNARKQTFTASAIIFPSVDNVEGSLYWADSGNNKVFSAASDGSNMKTIASGVHSPVDIVLDFDGQKIYWANEVTGKIERTGLDGSNKENLVVNVTQPLALSLDLNAKKIYWINDQTKSIHRANLDGSNQEQIVTGMDSPMYSGNFRLDATGGKMYWAEGHEDKTGKICRSDLDGSNVEDLVTGLGEISSMALDVDGAKVYWADTKNKKIQRANLDGSGVWTLLSNMRFVMALELDTINGKMYWAGDGNNRIQRASLDGSAMQTLVVGVNQPVDFVLDVAFGKMYWSDNQGNIIQSANLDGSGIETVVSGLDEPGVIAIGE